jgi:hypothetical protein
MTVSNKLVFPVSKLSIPDEINRVILEESGFSGICTDHTLTVIQSFGNTSAYLKTKYSTLILTSFYLTKLP